MKRKKIYSMLALGMAMVLTAGVPVSAADSPDTGSFDGDITETKPASKEEIEVNQEVQVSTDQEGNKLKVEITSSADATDVIEDKLTNTVASGKESDEVVDDVKPTTEGLDETQVKNLKDKSKEQFNIIDVQKIMVNLGNKPVTVKPVEPDVQNVAVEAAKKMAGKLGLTVLGDEETIAASADIHIPLGKDESAKVTIPFGGNNKPEPDKYDYFVLHFKNGVWETIPAQVTSEGVIIATFDSFSPVFVVKTEKAPVLPDEDDEKNNNDGEDNGGSDDGGSNGSLAGNTIADAARTDLTKADSAPAAALANPAVSPKTGE